MKQTPVQWLYDQIGDNAPYDYAAQIASYLEEAMKMEAEIPELSDKEIENIAVLHCGGMSNESIDEREGIIWGAKWARRWYREQLKQRQ